MLSLPSAPESPGSRSTTTGSARSPSAARDAACVHAHPASPRRSAGCAAYTQTPAPSPRPRACRSPYPGTGAARGGADWAARSPPLPACPEAASSRARWRPQPPRRWGSPPARSARCACCHSWPDPWDWGQFDPPKTRLAQRGVAGLPGEIHAAHFVAALRQHRPDFLKDAPLHPALVSAVHRGVVAKLLGQRVPLAAAAHDEDDAIERLALIDARAAGVRLRIVFAQDRLDEIGPEIVGNIPNRWQRLRRRFAFGHPWLLERG